jgi:prephenate dehydratase
MPEPSQASQTAPLPVPTRYGFLGPAGTFTEAALLTVPGAEEAERLPYESVPAALDAVRRGEVAGAVVAFENSVEGAVPATLDDLSIEEPPLHIVREILLPVEFALMGRPGTALEDIKTVASHPHAYPQCRKWLAENLPDARWIAASSNADAARLVSEGVHDAALAGAFAAPFYRLAVLARDIHDVSGAVTRFVMVVPAGPVPARTGADKTSLAVVLRDNHPGALLEILEEFAVRGVDLTRIESRPTRSRLGTYWFSIDCEGHLDDRRVGEALMGLRRVAAEVRYLGSYPRADKRPVEVRRGTSDEDFDEAAAWLRELRSR